MQKILNTAIDPMFSSLATKKGEGKDELSIFAFNPDQDPTMRLLDGMRCENKLSNMLEKKQYVDTFFKHEDMNKIVSTLVSVT
jgi:hypothetical protein